MFDLGMALIKNGDVTKGLSIKEMIDVSGTFDQGELLEKAAFEKYMEIGDYENAEQLRHFWSYDFKEYFDFLCKCIDRMKEKGEIDKAKSFIIKKVGFFSEADKKDEYAEWRQENVKQRLLDYLNL